MLAVKPIDDICFDQPQHWRDLADEARRTLDSMEDYSAKAMMTLVIRSYEVLAREAENRLKTHRSSHRDQAMFPFSAGDAEPSPSISPPEPVEK